MVTSVENTLWEAVAQWERFVCCKESVDQGRSRQSSCVSQAPADFFWEDRGLSSSLDLGFWKKAADVFPANFLSAIQPLSCVPNAQSASLVLGCCWLNGLNSPPPQDAWKWFTTVFSNLPALWAPRSKSSAGSESWALPFTSRIMSVAGGTAYLSLCTSCHVYFFLMEWKWL